MPRHCRRASFPVADAPAAIVVFGAPVDLDGRPGPTLARRLDAAEVAARRWPYAPIVVTGGAVRTSVPEALAMRDRLIARGVPAGRLVVEDQARNTLHSARLVAAVLPSIAGRRTSAPFVIVVVTSGYHALRCRLLLQAMGVRVVHAVVPAAERETMGHAAWLGAVLRESAALPWSLLRVWWKPRTRE